MTNENEKKEMINDKENGQKKMIRSIIKKETIKRIN